MIKKTLATARRSIPTPLLAVMVLSLMPFLWVWGIGHLFYDFDMAFITAPIEDLFARYQRAGMLPLWAPELQGGYPLIAISHMGFFYPLHAALRMFLPGVLTLNISLAAHALLGALGMFLFLRHERFRREAAALGALVVSGTGFFIGHLYITNVLLPLLWVPLELWLLGRWLHARSWAALLGLTIAGGSQILLGHPQSAFMSLSVLVLFTLTHLLLMPRQSFTRVLVLPAAAALTAVLALPQLQATTELIPLSDRADAILKTELYEFSFPLHHVVTWFFPHALGKDETYIGEKNDTELSSWFGATVLLIAAAGLWSPQKRFARPYVFGCLLLATSGLLASGAHSPVYRWLVEHQWITSFAIPARWMFLTLIGVAILAAHGLACLAAAPPHARRRLLTVSLVSVALLLVVSVSALSADRRAGALVSLGQHPFLTATPLLALLATGVVLLLPPTRPIPAGRPGVFRGRPALPALLLGIAALELLPPNISWNISVAFTEPFRRSRAEDVLALDRGPAPRLYSQLEMTTTPPPPITPAPLKRLEQTVRVEQTFQSPVEELHGLRLRVHWGTVPKTPGEILIHIEDPETGEHRERRVNALKLRDQEWETVLFAPLRHTEGHHLTVTVTSTHRSPGPWVFFWRTRRAGGTDVLPGGTVKLCSGTSCRHPTLAEAPGESADLVLEPIYPEASRISLARELLAPHIGASKGFPSSQWLGALQLHDVKRYVYAIGDQNENVQGWNPFLRERRGMVDRFGIGWFLGTQSPGRTLALDGTEPVQETFLISRFVRLFRNLQAYPRVHFADAVLSLRHPDEALAALQSPAFPRGTVTVEDDTRVRDTTLSTGNATIESYAPTEVIVKTKNPGTGFLVLRDTFFPHWEADIDGTPTRIFPTDMVFRGVLVPPGEHTVRFRYIPTATLRAIRLSAGAWIAAGTAAAALAIRHLRGKRPPFLSPLERRSERGYDPSGKEGVT